MAKFNGSKQIIYIQELDIKPDFPLGYNTCIFKRIFKNKNIYFFVGKDHSKKGESSYTIMHLETSDLKKWANTSTSFAKIAIDSKALFSLYVKNEQETIRRIQSKDIDGGEFWYCQEETPLKLEILRKMRNIELEELLA